MSAYHAHELVPFQNIPVNVPLDAPVMGSPLRADRHEGACWRGTWWR